MIETAANEPTEEERAFIAQLLNYLYDKAWDERLHPHVRDDAARKFLRISGCQDPCARKWLGIKGGRDK